MTFRVGQKVTLIKRGKWRGFDGEAVPQFGAIYTVRAITCFEGETFLFFHEIKNGARLYADGWGEMSFLASLFRPIVERKTDISIFTRMLNPSRENMDA